jgi:hypothetical protein
MTRMRKLECAWKHRRFLWKYRKLIRRRGEIAAVLAGGVAIAAVLLALRPVLASGPGMSGGRSS